MGQQPNIELEPADRPREAPEPAPPRFGRDTRPGVITAPDQMPTGSAFGRPGPDTGWALRIIRAAGLPETGEAHESVVAAIMGARASLFGRAPIPEDLAVARVLLGWEEGLPAQIEERGERWVAATAHEKTKGSTALAEIDPDLLRETPERIRYVLTR